MTSRRLVIEPSGPGLIEGLREVIRYRDLLWLLAYRDYRVRYAEAVLGFAWALIQPLLTLAVFTFVFGRVVRVDTGAAPYPLFAMAGLIAWTYFAFVLAQAGGSVVAAQDVVKKIYFPRLIVPLSKGVVGLVDLGIALAFFAVLMAWYRRVPGPQIVWLPVFLGGLLVFALAAGIWLSALTIRYRDFQHVVPFLVQIGVYATPVAYPAALVPAEHRWLLHLNPMAGIVEGFRWCLLGGTLSVPPVVSAIAASVFLLITGLLYFRTVERVVADVV